MGIPRRIGIAVVTAALTVAAGVGRAGDPPKQSAMSAADQDLLEFLGSVDSPADSTQQPDDDGWLTYLSQIDIEQVAKASQAPAQTPAQQKPASSAGTEKPNG
jgi:hypothetical protein